MIQGSSTHFHPLRYTLIVLLLTFQVFATESRNDRKTKVQSQTTLSESSSPSYGYTFYHYRRPRYSHKHSNYNSKAVSTYNGHPFFSYGKVTAYHTAPAITTYDAGFGTYGPSYDSMGGYKDVDYKQYHKYEKKCPYKQATIQHDEQDHDEIFKHEYEHREYPVYEGGRFAYTIYTDHGKPVYKRPIKNDHSHRGNYKPVSYGYHYSIKPHHVSRNPSNQHNKYPGSHVFNYHNNHYAEHTTKSKHTLTYPSEDHEDREDSQSSYSKPKYQIITEKPSIKYPSEDNIPHSSYDPWASFTCKHHYYPGFYADIQSHCSIWHYCQPDGRQDSFKCPKGTLFNQKSLTCDWWFNVDCLTSSRYYSINQQLYKLYKKKRDDKQTTTKLELHLK